MFHSLDSISISFSSCKKTEKRVPVDGIEPRTVRFRRCTRSSGPLVLLLSCNLYFSSYFRFVPRVSDLHLVFLICTLHFDFTPRVSDLHFAFRFCTSRLKLALLHSCFEPRIPVSQMDDPTSPAFSTRSRKRAEHPSSIGEFEHTGTTITVFNILACSICNEPIDELIGLVCETHLVCGTCYGRWDAGYQPMGSKRRMTGKRARDDAPKIRTCPKCNERIPHSLCTRGAVLVGTILRTIYKAAVPCGANVGAHELGGHEDCVDCRIALAEEKGKAAAVEDLYEFFKKRFLQEQKTDADCSLVMDKLTV